MRYHVRATSFDAGNNKNRGGRFVTVTGTLGGEPMRAFLSGPAAHEFEKAVMAVTPSGALPGDMGYVVEIEGAMRESRAGSPYVSATAMSVLDGPALRLHEIREMAQALRATSELSPEVLAFLDRVAPPTPAFDPAAYEPASDLDEPALDVGNAAAPTPEAPVALEARVAEATQQEVVAPVVSEDLPVESVVSEVPATPDAAAEPQTHADENAVTDEAITAPDTTPGENVVESADDAEVPAAAIPSVSADGVAASGDDVASPDEVENDLKASRNDFDGPDEDTSPALAEVAGIDMAEIDAVNSSPDSGGETTPFLDMSGSMQDPEDLEISHPVDSMDSMGNGGTSLDMQSLMDSVRAAEESAAPAEAPMTVVITDGPVDAPTAVALDDDFAPAPTFVASEAAPVAPTEVAVAASLDADSGFEDAPTSSTPQAEAKTMDSGLADLSALADESMAQQADIYAATLGDTTVAEVPVVRPQMEEAAPMESVTSAPQRADDAVSTAPAPAVSVVTDKVMGLSGFGQRPDNFRRNPEALESRSFTAAPADNDDFAPAPIRGAPASAAPTPDATPSVSAATPEPIQERATPASAALGRAIPAMPPRPRFGKRA